MSKVKTPFEHDIAQIHQMFNDDIYEMEDEAQKLLGLEPNENPNLNTGKFISHSSTYGEPIEEQTQKLWNEDTDLTFLCKVVILTAYKHGVSRHSVIKAIQEDMEANY